MLDIKVLKNILFAGAASVILTGGALAADAGGDYAVPTAPEADSAWDVAFGVTVTSDYVSRGITQTSGGAAVQPWAELTVGMFYLGYWGSNVDPGFTGGNWEHDLSVGIRPVVGPVSLDIGYVRYIYDTGDCCGEVYIKGEVTPVDPLTLGAHFFYSPDFSTTYAEVNASVALMDTVSASAAVGFIGNSAADYTTWNAGLTWNPVEPLEIDVRYHWAPSSIGNSVQKVVVSASISSSLRSLGVIR
jgi:uncharacterized protein (TIGR02001 family)